MDILQETVGREMAEGCLRRDRDTLGTNKSPKCCQCSCCCCQVQCSHHSWDSREHRSLYDARFWIFRVFDLGECIKRLGYQKGITTNWTNFSISCRRRYPSIEMCHGHIKCRNIASHSSVDNSSIIDCPSNIGFRFPAKAWISLRFHSEFSQDSVMYEPTHMCLRCKATTRFGKTSEE